jgi:predicted Rossmann-fold nucleotide-binding protein
MNEGISPAPALAPQPRPESSAKQGLIPPLFDHIKPHDLLTKGDLTLADNYALSFDISRNLSELVLALVAGNVATKQWDPHASTPPTHFHAEEDVLSLILEYANHPMVCVNGTARDKAVSEEFRLFAQRLAEKCVENGISHINGGSTTGAMGAATAAFEREISKARDVRGVSQSEIVTVRLKLGGEHAAYEPPKDLGDYGRSSKPQEGWICRTPLLHGIGRQDAMVHAPGGLGTLYEVLLPLACKALAHRGIAGMYGSTREAADFYFVSENNFWAPIIDQIAEMLACKTVKGQHVHTTPLSISTDEDREFAARMIVDQYRYAQEQREVAAAAKPPATTSEIATEAALREYAVDVQHRLGQTALAPRNVLEEAPNKFLGFLDNLVAAHRTIYHLRETMIRRELGENELAEAYLQEVEQGAAEEREIFLREMNRLAEKPAIYLIGACKPVWTQELAEYSDELIRLAVELGITIAIDGRGNEGMPDRWTKLWVKHMKDYEKRHGVRSASELVRAQLALEGEEVPARHLDGFGETVFPSLLNVETKAAVLGSVGCNSKRAVVLAPAGFAELAAFSQLELDMQLAGSVLGCYESHDKRPELTVLNVPMAPGRMPFYRGFRDQHEVMVKGKTINPEDFNPETYDRLLNPRESARKLIEKMGL